MDEEDIYEDEYGNDGYDEEDKRREYEEEEEEKPEDAFAEEDKFIAERSAYERAGGRKNLIDFLGTVFEKGGDKKLEEIQRRLLRSGLSDEENFKIILQAYINRFRDDISISDRDIENIENILPNIQHIKYKNAPAFLMGYYVLDKSKNIDKGRLNVSANLLKSEDVYKADIIRYARLLSKYV